LPVLLNPSDLPKNFLAFIPPSFPPRVPSANPTTLNPSRGGPPRLRPTGVPPRPSTPTTSLTFSFFFFSPFPFLSPFELGKLGAEGSPFPPSFYSPRCPPPDLFFFCQSFFSIYRGDTLRRSHDIPHGSLSMPLTLSTPPFPLPFLPRLSCFFANGLVDPLQLGFRVTWSTL